MNPIISIKEARKILGEESKSLSDEELIKLIDDIDFLAKYVIDKYKREKVTNFNFED